MTYLYSAYLDESGIDKGNDFVAVAGFVSNTSKWNAFSQEWKPLLDEWQIPYFHMTDFENRRSYYSSWSKEERETRLNCLLGIIKKHTFLSVGYVIRKRQFNEIMTDRAKDLCGNAYGLASIGCWYAIRQKVKNVDGLVDYTMESVNQGSGALLKIHGIQSKFPEWVEDTCMHSLSFRDKHTFLPLQAADILAYELFKQAKRQFGGEKRKPRYPLQQLAIPNRQEWHYADDAELQNTNDYLNGLLSKWDST